MNIPFALEPSDEFSHPLACMGLYMNFVPSVTLLTAGEGGGKDERRRHVHTNFILYHDKVTNFQPLQVDPLRLPHLSPSDVMIPIWIPEPTP